MLRRKVLLVNEIYINNAIIDFTWSDNRLKLFVLFQDNDYVCYV